MTDESTVLDEAAPNVDAAHWNAWGPHMRALWAYMQEKGLRLGGITEGSDASATSEDRAEAILASLKEGEAGGWELVADIGESIVDKLRADLKPRKSWRVRKAKLEAEVAKLTATEADLRFTTREANLAAFEAEKSLVRWRLLVLAHWVAMLILVAWGW
jgi:hypothetical protein